MSDVIEITDKMIHVATLWANEDTRVIQANRNKYERGDFEAQDKGLEGYLAEMVFLKLLVGHGLVEEKDFTWSKRNRVAGKPDGGNDFFLNNSSIDVKYIPHYGYFFAVNIGELDRKDRKGQKSDWYVGVELNMTSKKGTYLCHYSDAEVRSLDIESQKFPYPARAIRKNIIPEEKVSVERFLATLVPGTT